MLIHEMIRDGKQYKYWGIKRYDPHTPIKLTEWLIAVRVGDELQLWHTDGKPSVIGVLMGFYRDEDILDRQIAYQVFRPETVVKLAN